MDNPATVTKLSQTPIERHPDFAAGFSPSIRADGAHGIEILLDKGGDKMAARIQSELVPGLEKGAEELDP